MKSTIFKYFSFAFFAEVYIWSTIFSKFSNNPVDFFINWAKSLIFTAMAYEALFLKKLGNNISYFAKMFVKCIFFIFNRVFSQSASFVLKNVCGSFFYEIIWLLKSSRYAAFWIIWLKSSIILFFVFPKRCFSFLKLIFCLVMKVYKILAICWLLQF